VAVHHVEMKEFDAFTLHGRDLVGEVGEVACEETRCHRSARFVRAFLSVN
jgi:hypothetical protein